MFGRLAGRFRLAARRVRFVPVPIGERIPVGIRFLAAGGSSIRGFGCVWFVRLVLHFDNVVFFEIVVVLLFVRSGIHRRAGQRRFVTRSISRSGLTRWLPRGKSWRGGLRFRSGRRCRSRLSEQVSFQILPWIEVVTRLGVMRCRAHVVTLPIPCRICKWERKSVPRLWELAEP